MQTLLDGIVRHYLFAACMIAFAASPTHLFGQEAAECASAAAAIALVARPDILSDTSASARQLFLCPEAGPAQISRLWSLNDLSEAESELLRYRSRILLDRRILTTLLSLARNASKASHIRQAASAATLPYVDRGIDARIASLRSAENRRESVSLVSGSADIRLGGSPPTVASSQDVARLMADLAAQSQDAALQQIGRAGFRDVIERAPEAAVIPVSAVTLTYMCGNRFRFRNRVFANLTLRYDVYGASESGQFAVVTPEPGSAQTEIFFTARSKGTVRVFYRSQLLQTKANGGTVCS